MKDFFSLVLASSSPRRKSLLSQAGYEFLVVEPEVDESGFSSEGVGSCDYAKQLALAKAKNVADKFVDSVVIGADTIVDYEGEIIGKPADIKDAEQTARKLFGKAHKVITGIAIVRLNDGLEIIESDTTVVYPKKMSDSQIAEHLKGGSWRGKAGGYGIQERGDEFVEKIDGSLTNVMGMPMELLQRVLDGLKK
ncbi:Maf family protein [Planctomycetota bacterium]